MWPNARTYVQVETCKGYEFEELLDNYEHGLIRLTLIQIVKNEGKQYCESVYNADK